MLAVGAAVSLAFGAAHAADKPNIVLIVSDDFGYGDAGIYGGGPNRGMPTPALDRMANEGMTFMSFYAQPSCTPGRAAMQTGRIPNRSGMTTVAFQGQGGGLPAAEWTLASVLKQGGYQTYFTGKWHLGEADYALPNAQGYDEMKAVGLYHLNAYTYGDPTWFPDMDPELRAMFQKVTTGALSGKAGEKAHEDFKINGQYVNEPGKSVTLHGVTYPDGVVGIPFIDEYIEKAGIEYLEKAAKDPSKPFFVNINFMKVHQPNMPAPDFQLKSMSKSKYADSVVEADTRIGHVLDKIRQLGLDKNTLVFWTTDNGAWQDVYPDAGYTPFRGTKGTVARQDQARFEELRHRRRARSDGDVRERGGRIAAQERPRGQADHLRQLRHDAGALRDRQVGAQGMVLLHRERAHAGCGPGGQLQGGVQPARRRRAGHGRAGGGLEPGLEGRREVCRDGSTGFRPLAGPAGALRHLHEQLHRAHLDARDDQRCDQEPDEDVRPIPAAQAAERVLFRPHHADAVPAIPVRA
jgi:hypothetical protein